MHNKRISVLLDRKITANQTSYICGLQQRYEFSLHNHAFICHNNKRRAVPSHYSKSSNYYQDILFSNYRWLTWLHTNSNDTWQQTSPNYICWHELILLMRSAIPHLYASHATRAPTGANKIQCLQGKPALVEADKLIHHGKPARLDDPFRPSNPGSLPWCDGGQRSYRWCRCHLGGVCPRHHMLPDIVLDLTTGLTVGADRAHQVAIRTDAQE